MAHAHSHDHEHGLHHDHAANHDHDHEHSHKHGRFQLARKTRLRAVIAISFCFFAAEISVGFYTGSLALVADAFHYVCHFTSLQSPHLTLPAQRPRRLHRRPRRCPSLRAQNLTSRSLLRLGARLTPWRLLQRRLPPGSRR
jgi:hypothetical protein